MLLEYFKNKIDKKTINTWWYNFRYKNGHKHINIGNFLELKYQWCSYVVNKRYYKGFFTSQEIDNIFKVLDYNEGRIRVLNG